MVRFGFEVIELLAETDSMLQPGRGNPVDRPNIWNRKGIQIRITCDRERVTGISQIGRSRIVHRPDANIVRHVSRTVVADAVRDGQEIGVPGFLTEDAFGKTGQQLMCPLLMTEAGVNDRSQQRESIGNTSMLPWITFDPPCPSNVNSAEISVFWLIRSPTWPGPSS